AELEDPVTERDRALSVTGLVRIEQDQWMQVAVAGVEHVRARQSELPCPGLDLPQHARQCGAGDRAVDAVVIGRNSADGGECRLAAGPVQQALRLRFPHTALSGATRP